MIRPPTRLFVCIGILLLALVPATPSLAFSTQGQGHRPMLGQLPLDIAQIQRDADYTRDDKSYFNPTFGLIALGVGALLGLAWFFGGDPAARLRGDPVPSRLRNRLDRLDSARLAVLAGVRAAKALAPEPALSEEKLIYDRLAADTDAVLDKMRRDLLLNQVDEEFLVPALDRLAERARGLSVRLARIAPVRSPVDFYKSRPSVGQGPFSRINRSWERVFSGESPKMATIRHASAMRWPSWPSIEAPPRKPE